ncbi:unnamed protein product [Allacma fusca]|uniref:Uncharacterized protein n=1 Tax=Allacma fusca TaxID=39272 RepID=A0A8J2JKR2_9HEXA|nr:unnamed protein product [Allacma fusca]
MTSENILSTYGNIINLGFKCGFIPFFWSQKSGKVTIHESLLRRSVLKIFIGLILTYEIFLVPRCIQTLMSKEVDTRTKITVFYFGFGYLCYMVNEYIITHHFGVHESLVNNLITLLREFQQDRPDAVLSTGKFMKLLRLWFFMCAFIPVTNVRKVFRTPGLPPLLTSLFPNPANIPLGFRILIALYHFCILGMHFYLLLLNSSTVILFCFININIITNLRNNIKSSQEFFKYYRSLSILQSHFCAIFGPWTIGAVGTSTVGIIINTFLAVVYSRPREFVVGSMGSYVVLNFCKVIGQVNEQSVETLSACKHVGFRTKEFRRVHRALRPVRMTVGTFFYADKFFMLTILTTILSNSANLILTFRYE